MKTLSRFSLVLLISLGFPGILLSDDEHSDIEFSYSNGMIDVEFGDEGPVFEGEFPTEGVDLQFTSEPGFGSELEEGLGINAGDQIAYNVLSELMFWNEGFKPVPNNAQIRIINRPPSPQVPDTIVGVGSGEQLGSFDPAMNRVGAAEADGDFHSDLDFFLEPKGDTADPSMYGVYGFMASISTDADGIGNSDPFAMVFNFGLEEDKFEAGVAAFASTVPEPVGGNSVLIAILGCLICVRSRTKAKLRS